MHVLRVDLDDIADLSAVELRVTAGGIADAVVIIPAAGRSRDEHVILGGAVGIVHGRFAGRPVIDRVNVVLDPGELAWVKDNVDPVYNWASGEPSVHDTNGAAEDYVLITRTSSGWYYNDCIGDPAGRYPQFYSGKIGYIIEIDP